MDDEYYDNDDYDPEDEDEDEETNASSDDDNEKIPTIQLNTSAKPSWDSRFWELRKFHRTNLEDPTKNFLSAINNFAGWLYNNWGETKTLSPWQKWRSMITEPVAIIKKALKDVGFASGVELPTIQTTEKPTAKKIARRIIEDINAVFLRFDNNYSWGRKANEYAAKWLNDQEKNFDFYTLTKGIKKKLTGKNARKFEEEESHRNTRTYEELWRTKSGVQNLNNENEIRKYAEDEKQPKSGSTNKQQKTNELLVLTEKALKQYNVKTLTKLVYLIKKMQKEEKITGIYEVNWDNFRKNHLTRIIKMYNKINKQLKTLGF